MKKKVKRKYTKRSDRWALKKNEPIISEQMKAEAGELRPEPAFTVEAKPRDFAGEVNYTPIISECKLPPVDAAIQSTKRVSDLKELVRVVEGDLIAACGLLANVASADPQIVAVSRLLNSAIDRLERSYL